MCFMLVFYPAPLRCALSHPLWVRAQSAPFVLHCSGGLGPALSHPRPGELHLLTAPAPSKCKAIRGMLGKFADIPHEVEAGSGPR
jgi:hypothetical protein